MAKQQTDSPFNQDEFQRIFDEYRSKIEEITRCTGRSLESLRVPPMELDEELEPEEKPTAETDFEETAEEPEPEEAPAPAPEAVHFIEKPVPAPAPAPERYTPPVIRDEPEVRLPESKRIIQQANKEAQRILQEAEKQARKQARDKTKNQVDKILAKARQEAEEYVEKIRQAVDQERNATMEAARTQAEQSLLEMTEQFRKLAYAKSAQIVEEAQVRADRLMHEITQASTEVSGKITEIIERSRTTVTEFQERLQTETGDISQAIVDTQSRIEALAMAAAEATEQPAPAPSARAEVPPATPTMIMRVLGERSNGRNGTQPLFFGMVELNAPSETCDSKLFKSMKRYLVGIPGVKQLQESASEKELSALFDLSEPLPLLELLSKVPQVDEVVCRSDRDIALTFKQ